MRGRGLNRWGAYAVVRYPDFYNDGQSFLVWANNYTRVLQTAQMFVRGYLGPLAPTYGNVVAVTAKGYPGATGDSLAPGDMCPKFADTEGAAQQAIWTTKFVPPIKQRLQAMIKGNLTLTDGDILQIPYLCGFESQITGRLSPWCGVFTDDELKSYEYYNDLRYYYGIGPGTDLPSQMMMPFVNLLVSLLKQGPSITGTHANGTIFTLPKLLMAFMNDGQINQVVTAVGVFDNQAPLDPAVRDDSRLFMASRFGTMRGTIALERLNCLVKDKPISGPHNATTTAAPTGRPTPPARRCRTCGNPKPPRNEAFIRIRLNDAVYPLPSCRDGPGASCRLADYAKYIAEKYKAQGNWAQNCNVTTPGSPTVVKGASFFTDLSKPWLRILAP